MYFVLSRMMWNKAASALASLTQSVQATLNTVAQLLSMLSLRTGWCEMMQHWCWLLWFSLSRLPWTQKHSHWVCCSTKWMMWNAAAWVLVSLIQSVYICAAHTKRKGGGGKCQKRVKTTLHILNEILVSALLSWWSESAMQAAQWTIGSSSFDLMSQDCPAQSTALWWWLFWFGVSRVPCMQ